MSDTDGESRVFSAITATRVIACKAALDTVAVTAGATILRFADDDALIIDGEATRLDDPDAIIEPETGLVGAWFLDAATLQPHIAWPLPEGRGVVAQGAIRGVGARIFIDESRRALVLVAAPVAQELAERLS
jgi:hypothetical protein